MSAAVLLPVIFGLAALLWTIKIACSWRGGKYLCDDCKFNNDEDCKKAIRPQAEICMAYRKGAGRISEVTKPAEESSPASASE